MNMKKLFFLFLLILWNHNVFGQAFTSVIGTLTDTSSQVWSSAIVQAQFVPAFGNPNPSLNQGHVITDSVQSVTADNTGTFSLTLDDNSKVTPTGSQWRFTICPNAVVAVCSSTTVFISGASMNLSSILSAALTVPSVFVSPYAYRAYNDTEALASTGALYWRTSDNSLRGCVGFPCTWQAIGGGYNTIDNSGTPLTQRFILNMTGPGVSCVDNAGSSRTDCTFSASGGAVSGSGTSTFIPLWTNPTTLGNSGIRDQASASWPSGNVVTDQHSLFVSADNAFGTTCSAVGISTAPACIAQSWTTTDLLTFVNPFVGLGVVSGFNGASIPALGSAPQLIGIQINNGQTVGSVTGTLTAQAGLLINPINGSASETVTNDYSIYLRAMQNNGTVSHHYGLFMEDQTTTNNAGPNPVDPWGLYVTKGKSFFGSQVQLGANTFSTLPTCNAGAAGNIDTVSDSTVTAYGSTITGGGSSTVEAFCNGATWVVMGSNNSGFGNALISTSAGQILEVFDITPCNNPACSASMPHTFTSTPKCVATGHGGSVDISTSAPPTTTTITLDSSGVASATVYCVGNN